MFGLIIKDLLNLRKQCRVFILLFTLYLVLSFSTKDLTFFMAMSAIIMAMLPITALAYDERAKFEKYALTMPISRNDLVKAKYFLGILLSLVSLVINFAINILGYYTMGIEITHESISYIIVMFCASVLFISIMLPLNFKFGVEKGRYFLMIVVLIPTLAVLIGKNMFPNVITTLEGYADNINSININTIVFYSIAFTFVFCVLSMLISMKIYSKKEY